jgi:hypothetical protein
MERAAEAALPWRAAAATGACAGAAALGAMALLPRPFTLCRDNAGLFYGLSLEAWRAWTQGRLPHWSDAFWGGFPLLGDSTSAALYLPHLVAFLFTPSPHLRAFDVAMALHLGILVTGSVVLLGLLGVRRSSAVVGGVLALLCPYLSWCGVSFLPVLGAQAWWPWALVGAELLARPGATVPWRGFAIGWIALAAQVMVGVPEQAVYSASLTSLWLLTRRAGVPAGRRALRLVVLGVGAAALAAPQLLPTAAYVATTNRADAPAAAELASLWLTDPLALVVAGWGVLNGVPTFYGLVSLALAAAGVVSRRPRAGFLAATAAVGFLLALGAQTPVYGWLHRLPPFDHFRSPAKFEAVAELAVAWLAALGLDAMRDGAARARRVAAVLALAAVGERAVYATQAASLLWRSCAGAYGATAALEALGPSVLARPPAVGEPPPLVYDTYGPDLDTFARNLTATFGIASLTGGRVSLLSRRHERLLVLRLPGRPVLDLLGVRYLLARRDECDALERRTGFTVAERRPAVCVLANPSAPPRYALVRDLLPVETEDAMLDAVDRYAGGAVPVLGTSPAFDRAATSGDVRVARYAAGAIDLVVHAGDAALLLVRHSWVPGWSARVDGRPVAVEQAAGLYFALPVPAGEHAVTLRYRTPWLGTGVGVAVAWVLLVLAVARRRRAIVAG